MNRHAVHSSQRGYALVELALVLLITSLLATWGVHTLVNRIHDAQARSAAAWMAAMHKAVLAYVQRYGPEIQEAEHPDALAIHGFADWRAPAFAELKQAGLLSAGMPENAPLTGPARVIVWHQGECPGDACIVEAIVYGEWPVRDLKRGEPDEAKVAQWLLASEGEGAAVHPREPDRIQGAAYSYSSTLPDGTVLPVGTVARAVTAEQQALWSFLRVKDRRDPDFQGALSVAGNLHSRADATVAGKLTIGAQFHDGMECETEKAVAHHVLGGLLVCHLGRWRSSGRAGGGYGYNLLYGCETSEGYPMANPVTGDCSCPWYTSTVPIFDSGPQPSSHGRQIAYLCVG